MRPADLGTEFRPLSELLPLLRSGLQRAGQLSLIAPDPDSGAGLYAGELTLAGRHRSYATWADIADVLGARLGTPERRDGGRVRLALHRLPPLDRQAEYGEGSDFQRLDKLEDPWFLHGFTEALTRVKLHPGARILSAGVGSGRELDALEIAYPDQKFGVVGLDIDAGVLELARQRHAGKGWTFQIGDVNALDAELGRFDLIIALSVLQSRNVNLERSLRGLMRDHLTPTGSLILGFPNCRYAGGEVRYGARMLNFRDPDLSLLLADVALVRRHLHKSGFKVYVTGKYEVLVTAVPV